MSIISLSTCFQNVYLKYFLGKEESELPPQDSFIKINDSIAKNLAFFKYIINNSDPDDFQVDVKLYDKNKYHMCTISAGAFDEVSGIRVPRALYVRSADGDIIAGYFPEYGEYGPSVIRVLTGPGDPEYSIKINYSSKGKITGYEIYDGGYSSSATAKAVLDKNGNIVSGSLTGLENYSDLFISGYYNLDQYSAVSTTLIGDQENLTLIGSKNINGTGNNLDNSIIGNSGNNILDGAQGTDRLYGEKGNDTYIIRENIQTVHESSNYGTDTVKAYINYTLGDNIENLILEGNALKGYGNSLKNKITGSAGNDTINGMGGVDTMIGGNGDDTYYVDDRKDVVTEASTSGSGVDTVRSSAITYTLAKNVEFLYLVDGAVTAIGNSSNNTIEGNNAANCLYGMAGDDLILTQGGNDTVYGGTGNDVLSGREGSDVLYGEAGNDTLTGSAGINTLVGGTGNDMLYGDINSDTYIFYKGDKLDTINDSGGFDKVKFGKNVSYKKIAFFVESNGNLTIDYGSKAGQDKITISNWSNDDNKKVEYFELSNGYSILDTDIDTIIQAITTYNTNNAVDLTSAEAVKANHEIMLTINALWKDNSKLVI